MTESLRAVVVDDEPLARAGITHDLSAIGMPRIEVVAQAANAFGALAILQRDKPDVLFLDIEMPEMSGFDLLAQLEPEDLPAAVIIVTAHNEHALRGYDANALDFLLKPYTKERLRVAIDRACARVEETRLLRIASEHADAQASLTSHTNNGCENILVTERDRTIVVPVEDVEYIEAMSYYARVHAPPKAWLIRERMSVLATALDAKRFFRTHRSAIVQLACVREIVQVSKYEQEVLLASGARAPLARSKRAELERLLR